MKKMTNTQKILKALRSGPKTQADLIRETKVKNVYQIVSDLRKKKIAFMDTANCVNLRPIPLVVDETDKVDAKKASEVVHGAIRMRHSTNHSVAVEKAAKEAEKAAKEHADRIAMLKDEIDNINDGIRALMMTRSYLLRRAEEESRRA